MSWLITQLYESLRELVSASGVVYVEEQSHSMSRQLKVVWAL